MFDRLSARADHLADQAADARRVEIAARPLPNGVTATVTADGVILSGKRLRRRFINDPALRNFAR
jgi:hypothetical protein